MDDHLQGFLTRPEWVFMSTLQLAQTQCIPKNTRFLMQNEILWKKIGKYIPTPL